MPTGLVVVVFEDAFDDRSSVAGAVAAAGHQVHQHPGCLVAVGSRHVADILRETRAAVAVWDLCPALGCYCADLEGLLEGGAFVPCRVVVTTTSAPRVREYLGSLAGSVTILQKPVPAEILQLAITHRPAMV